MNSFELPRQTIKEVEPQSLSAGKRLEKQVFEDVDCAWDGERWIDTRKSNKKEAFRELDEWAEAQQIKGWRETRDNLQRKEMLIEWVKNHQPWNPHEPHKISFTEKRGPRNVMVESTVPTDLHYFVAEKLGLEDYSGLTFYTCTGTPLDTVYGIDGFMEWNGVRITLDITKNSGKLEDQRWTEDKADYIFTLHDVNEEGSFQKVSPDEIELVAANIASSLRNNTRKAA